MDKLRSLFDALCRTAEAFPDRPAWLLLDNEERASSAFLPTAQTSMELGNQRPRIITWRETQATVERLAYWLSEQGLREGDRIANLERNSFEWACLDLACAALGCIHSPLDTRAGSESIRRSIGLLEPRVVFGCNPSVLDCPTMSLRSAMTAAVQAPVERLRASWSDRDRSSETATILWTSGTTSQPKGAMLSHSNLLSNATAKLDAMPQSETDLRLNLLPFAHAYARTCELTTWLLTGGTMACVGSVREFLDVAPRIQPTLINSVPSMIEAFLVPRDRESIVSPKGSSGENCDDLLAILGGSVRRLASGGAGISASTRELFANAGLPIYQGYGLTEASPVVCSNRVTSENQPMLEGVGPPVEGVEVRIDAENRLWVRGCGVMQGYWRDPEGTERRMREGWLDTGDCVVPGSEIERGLRIAGRSDDLQILSNGFKFFPGPLEAKIERLREIERCVLVGGNRRTPLLIVQLTPGFEIEPELLLRLVHRELAQEAEYVQPGQILISQEDWSVTDGLRHWKGGWNRQEIAKRTIRF